jgi:hypothetical protein
MYIRTRPTGIGYLAQRVTADPVVEAGEKLWKAAPAGVNVAIYASGNAEFMRRAKEWAEREGAVGVKATRIQATELTFGRALADSGRFVAQVTQLGAALKDAVARAEKPKGIEPLAGTGPSLIRVLALFSHGTNRWLGIGQGITTTNVATVIRGIAPVLTNDVKILIFGCSAALGQSEPSEWVRTTMEPGGANSLAGMIRDALVDQGKRAASVWGHTKVGHTTRNPSLRVFSAGRGKGTDGLPYAGDSVFGTIEKAFALRELEETIRALGFRLGKDKEEDFRKIGYQALRQQMYNAYVGAIVKTTTVRGVKRRVTNLTHRGVNLPEMAPLYPLDVADVIRKYWSTVYWTQVRKETVATSLAKRLKLARA